ncbi:hypothetical protein F5B21DRAFT_241309 [Xylaria acuta]|nr:hypothetical protein F5B21DRAFT_241309 [Xylaria acuta]
MTNLLLGIGWSCFIASHVYLQHRPGLRGRGCTANGHFKVSAKATSKLIRYYAANAGRNSATSRTALRDLGSPGLGEEGLHGVYLTNPSYYYMQIDTYLYGSCIYAKTRPMVACGYVAVPSHE